MSNNNLGMFIVGYLKDGSCNADEFAKFICPRCGNTWSDKGFMIEANVRIAVNGDQNVTADPQLRVFRDSQCMCGRCSYTDKFDNMI